MARTAHLDCRLSAAELLAIAGAAATSGMTPSGWLRHQALRAASASSAAAAAHPEPRPPFQPPPLATLSATPSATPPATPLATPPAIPPAKLTRPAHTRFTDQQFAALAAHALACGLPLAAFIRQAVLGVTPVARRPLAHAAVVALNRVGNNLNQLVHLAHTGVVLPPDLRHAVAAVLGQVLALRDALLDADTADAPDPAEPPEPPE